MSLLCMMKKSSVFLFFTLNIYIYLKNNNMTLFSYIISRQTYYTGYSIKYIMCVCALCTSKSDKLYKSETMKTMRMHFIGIIWLKKLHTMHLHILGILKSSKINHNRNDQFMEFFLTLLYYLFFLITLVWHMVINLNNYNK